MPLAKYVNSTRNFLDRVIVHSRFLRCSIVLFVFSLVLLLDCAVLLLLRLLLGMLGFRTASRVWVRRYGCAERRNTIHAHLESHQHHPIPLLRCSILILLLGHALQSFQFLNEEIPPIHVVLSTHPRFGTFEAGNRSTGHVRSRSWRQKGRRIHTWVVPGSELTFGVLVDWFGMIHLPIRVHGSISIICTSFCTSISRERRWVRCGSRGRGTTFVVLAATTADTVNSLLGVYRIVHGPVRALASIGKRARDLLETSV